MAVTKKTVSGKTVKKGATKSAAKPGAKSSKMVTAMAIRTGVTRF